MRHAESAHRFRMSEIGGSGDCAPSLCSQPTTCRVGSLACASVPGGRCGTVQAMAMLDFMEALADMSSSTALPTTVEKPAVNTANQHYHSSNGRRRIRRHLTALVVVPDMGQCSSLRHNLELTEAIKAMAV